jgi:hypothetical protein
MPVSMSSTAMADIGRSLELRADQLIDLQLAALQSHPSYPELRELDLRHSARRNVRRASAIIRGAGPEFGSEDDLLFSTVLHVVPGLAPEDVVSAFRAVMAVIRDVFLEEAAHAPMPEICTVDGLRRLWELTDQYSSLLATAHARSRITGLQRRADRLELLGRALLDDLSPGEIEIMPAVLGLEPDSVVTVFRVYSERALNPDALAALQVQVIGWPTTSLITHIGRELVGLALETPKAIDEATAVMAVSAPVPLADLATGYRDAGAVLAAARRFGLIGVVDAQRMGLRTAVLAVPRLSERLYARYVEAVFEATPMASDLLHTVDVFLTYQRRYQRAAQELNMHVNSLRHRLERYREITGADLGDTETVAEVWWALQYGRGCALLDGLH